MRRFNPAARVRLAASALVITSMVSATHGHHPVSAAASPITGQVDIVGGAGSTFFGVDVLVLSNGNYVVADPRWSSGGDSSPGAVYLFDGESNTVISTLTGGTFDRIGSGGLTEVGDSNFVVSSPEWGDGRGAATFVDGEVGLDGVVSAANSLVGAGDDDEIGERPDPEDNGSSGVIALANGNYVVSAPEWDNGSAENAGAIVLGDGAKGTTGVVSTSNSLHGSSEDDEIGLVRPLDNGDFLVVSREWQEPGTDFVGAVTWVDGDTGLVGPVSSANSLTRLGDVDSSLDIELIELPDGYIVSNEDWINPVGPIDRAGAVTWGSKDGGVSGPVSSSNSLIGDTPDRSVAEEGVVALSNGNYVVASTWDFGGADNVGAVTWGDGSSGVTGVLSSANSLHGTTDGDRVGGNGVTALTNGHFVVASPNWDGDVVNAGAATWIDGEAGRVGPLTASGSLTGTKIDDFVGVDSVALSTGDYVVLSPAWGNGGELQVGAATLVGGSGAITDTVSTANSLHGTSQSDRVGERATALTNGNYVVASPVWSGDQGVVGGAVTWSSGSGGLTGPVTTANSLYGTSNGDRVGSVAPLENGNYVVVSDRWKDAGGVMVGATTWGNGTTGTTGPVSVSNSRTGTQAGDLNKARVFPFSTGDYVVQYPRWDLGDTVDVGAIMWASGRSPVTGVVSTENALHGSGRDDFGFDDDGLVQEVLSGNYIVFASRWDSPDLENAGVVTFGAAGVGVTGSPSPSNSVIGEENPFVDDVQSLGSLSQPSSSLTSGDAIVVPTFVNKVSLLQLDITDIDTSEPEIVSLTPGRVFASRTSDETVDGRFEGDGRLAEGEFVEVDIAGRAGVADDAKGVVMNVTAVNPSGRGYVTTYPCDDRPLASSLNYGAAGAVVGNELVAKLSDRGSVCVFTFAETDLTIDVVGYVPASSSVVSLDPARVYGTRAIDETVDAQQQAVGKLEGGTFAEVDIAGRAGVPSIGTASVVMNITAVNTAGRGFVTTYPCGDRPLASSLNYGVAGVVAGNELISKLSATGTVCIYSSADTDLTVDVVGYVPSTSPATSLDPGRVYATRSTDETVDGEQQATGRVAAGGVVEVDIAGRAGVPAVGTGAVVMNITAVNPTGRGFITTYPCATRPLASSLNFGAAGAVVGNELVAKLSAEGTVCVYASAATDLTVDVVGYVPA